MAGDLHRPHDAARDGHLDVVAASPHRPARPAPPRGRPPPPLASRHDHSDQYFAPSLGLSVVVLLLGEQLVARLRKY